VEIWCWRGSVVKLESLPAIDDAKHKALEELATKLGVDPPGWRLVSVRR